MNERYGDLTETTTRSGSYTETTCEVSCAGCWMNFDESWDEHDCCPRPLELYCKASTAEKQLRKDGWRKDRKLGWLCPECLWRAEKKE